MLTISVLKESVEGEKRVALVPESVKRLAKQGVTILVQEGVGVEAGFNPSDYEAAGAAIVSDYDELLGEGNIFLKIFTLICPDITFSNNFSEPSAISSFVPKYCPITGLVK